MRSKRLPPRRPPAASEGRLTPAQETVLRLRAAGLSARDVARRLGVTVRTASEHAQEAYRTLGAHNLQQALLAAGIVVIVPQNGAER